MSPTEDRAAFRAILLDFIDSWTVVPKWPFSILNAIKRDAALRVLDRAVELHRNAMQEKDLEIWRLRLELTLSEENARA